MQDIDLEERDARRRPLGEDEDDPGAVFDVVLLGYLSVRVLFLGEPVEGLRVTFSDANGQVGLAGNTDRNGVYCHNNQNPVRVEVGTYECTIERQGAPVRITTVEHQSRPYVLVLPLGRAYFDRYSPPDPPVRFAANANPVADRGHLTVKVVFLGEPVENVPVAFLDANGAISNGVTDARGVFAHPHNPIEAGTYECRVDQAPSAQPPVRVTTVEHADRPYVLTLPIGRPAQETRG